jgi:hypothetical protein
MKPSLTTTDIISNPEFRSKGTENLTNLHNQLREKYKNTAPEDFSLDTASASLMAYNGYYTLSNTPGAFLSIDTNMVIKPPKANQLVTPIYDISIIFSLDGTTSHIFPFTKATGSFDGTTLNFKDGGFSIHIAFSRTNLNGATAIFEGTITQPIIINNTTKSTSTSVIGTTYNNIIPMSMYEGTYIEKILGTIDDPMMEIKPDYTLNYKAAGLFKTMKNVASYVYNMNMYFFSFMQEENTVKLIMGTSAQDGLVCNNMIIPPGPDAAVKTVSRTLTTGTKSSKNTPSGLNSNSKELANFSGFYHISSTQSGALKPGAFISVEGIYNISSGASNPIYTVKVGISLDGTTTKVITIDTNATFNTVKNKLTIPSDILEIADTVLTFTAGYTTVPSSKGKFGTLFSVSGTINGIPIKGTNPLGPVPLTAFMGAPMTNLTSNETLVIKSDSEIIYNGNIYEEILYVPVMYILAFDSMPGKVVGLSLGTDGGKGTACIITNTSTTPMFSSVFGIPSGQSGQPKSPL